MKNVSSRDREELEFVVDEHLKGVLEFMQGYVPAPKLIGVAESVTQMARLLWSHYSQEPVIAASMRGKPLVATEYAPARDCVDGGSVVEVCGHAQ